MRVGAQLRICARAAIPEFRKEPDVGWIGWRFFICPIEMTPGFLSQPGSLSFEAAKEGSRVAVSRGVPVQFHLWAISVRASQQIASAEKA